MSSVHPQGFVKCAEISFKSLSSMNGELTIHGRVMDSLIKDEGNGD